jgi:hypothetical protein
MPGVAERAHDADGGTAGNGTREVRRRVHRSRVLCLR